MKGIILVGGKAEQGKSSLGKILKTKLEAQGNKCVVDLFAKYIKQLAKQMGWNGEKDEYWRTVLQDIGTDVAKGKLNFISIWAKRLAEDIMILDEVFDVDYFIIDDTRFRDEIYTMLSVFPDLVTTVKVVRIGHKSSLTPEQLKHRSEVDLDDFNFDYTVYSQTSGGLQHLEDEAMRVLGEKFYLKKD